MGLNNRRYAILWSQINVSSLWKLNEPIRRECGHCTASMNSCPPSLPPSFTPSPPSPTISPLHVATRTCTHTILQTFFQLAQFETKVIVYSGHLQPRTTYWGAKNMTVFLFRRLCPRLGQTREQPRPDVCDTHLPNCCPFHAALRTALVKTGPQLECITSVEAIRKQ